MNSNKDQQNGENLYKENKNTEEEISEDKSIPMEDIYKFGWSKYSELTNGRFAMLGFLAIILIELFTQKSFLNWIGIF